MNNLFLMDISTTFDKIDQELNSFLDKYYDNPLFWTILMIVLFAMAVWAIGYFTKK